MWSLQALTDWGEIFKYKEGFIFWENGKQAGTEGNRNGYSSVTYNYKTYNQHRVIWELHNGPIPSGYVVDHIDRNKTNNLIDNLRLTDMSVNSCNTDRKAIYFHANKWCARVSLGGKRHWLGRHDTETAALDAVRTFKEENNVY